MTLLAILPATAFCQSKSAPLQLRLGASSTSVTTMPMATPPRHTELRVMADAPVPGKRAHVFHEARPSRSQRALQGLLANASEDEPSVIDQSGENFRFERRGNAGRNISQGYKRMCDNVSAKLWDNPDGKRVKFDVAGKPGVAVEIPLR